MDVLNSDFAKDGILMHLLRCVFFISAHFEITTKAAHIPGRENIAADALSQNNLCLSSWTGASSRPRINSDSTGASGSSGASTTRLDDHGLVPIVQKLFAAGTAPSTRKVYSTGGRRYEDFCTVFKLNPYPTSEKILSLFVGYLYMEGLAPGTIKSYLAAVWYDQVARGFGNPNIGGMPQLEYVVRGLKRLTPMRTRKRLPITLAFLHRLKAVWKKETIREMPRCFGQQLASASSAS